VAVLAASGAAASAAEPIPGYGRPGGGVRPDILHPRGALRYRGDSHDATNHGAVGEYVVIFLGFARSCAAHRVFVRRGARRTSRM
jgi:hypothetical protein